MLPAYRTPTPLPALGMASLVLGVIAMLLAPLPVLGIPLSGCGILFGVIGFIAAFTVPGTYLRWAVGGLAASLSGQLAMNLAPGVCCRGLCARPQSAAVVAARSRSTHRMAACHLVSVECAAFLA